MLVDFQKALNIFSKLERDLRVPTLHPAFVLADSKRDKSFEPTFFVFTDRNEVYLHSFQLGAIPDSKYFDVQSPYGYGGPISNSENPGFLKAAYESYSEWAKKKGVLCEFVRFHPLLENWSFYEGEIVDDRETVAVNLGIQDLLFSYVTRARTAVRKAEKMDLKVRVATPKEFLDIFPEIYYSSLKVLGAGRSYYFNSSYFEKIMESPGAHGLICENSEGEPLGGALFLVEGRFLEYHLSAATEKGKVAGATNLLLHKGFELGQKLECSTAHLGGGRTKDPDDKLLFFKSGFSSIRKSFKVGKRIFLAEEYEKYKRDWELEHGNSNDRIMFYR